MRLFQPKGGGGGREEGALHLASKDMQLLEAQPACLWWEALMWPSEEQRSLLVQRWLFGFLALTCCAGRGEVSGAEEGAV